VGATTPAAGAFTTLSATGAIKSTGANLVNEASAAKLSQEGVATSRVSAYGNDASTQGVLQIRTVSSNGTASTIPAIFSSTGLAVTGELSATGAVTLSAGTANGVTYLNASKVLTSGSALTFDGTNLTTTGYAAGNGVRSLGGNPVRFYNAANANWSQISAPAGTGDMQFDTGAGEQMRLTSTGLGIGTSSPGAKLDVVGAARASNATYKGDIIIQQSNTALAGTGGLELVADAASSGYGARIQSIFNGASAYDLSFQLRNNSASWTQYMLLDRLGNLGLGVTPSAWAFSGSQALQIKNAGFVGFGNRAYVLANAYFNAAGQSVYIASDFATQYTQLNGTHTWFSAPSGTAGNTISFTQALTLDANRNLLLNGTTAGASSVGTFTVFNGTAPTGSVTDGVILFAQDISSSSELRVRDEAGNVTTLSPHNFELIPEGPSEEMAWSYYSERDGKRINVDMLKAIRLLERLSGEQLVYEA
jgi:hypothetical protein